MKTTDYYRSLSTELECLKNRVRNFIHDAHWQTDGEWKESVLRSILIRNMPETVKIGRGFIVTQDFSSTQIDILIYRNDTPVFFRDGDLVFIPPEGVLGVVEVKTNINASSFESALLKLVQIQIKIKSTLNQGMLFGLFAYESGTISNKTVMKKLKEVCASQGGIIDLLCLGDSIFVKWWKDNPSGENGEYKKWHSYELPELAPGYFIHNILTHISGDRYWINQDIWFPSESNEFNKSGEISLKE